MTKKLLLLTAFIICCFKIGYSQPGTLDSSFGTNGIVKADLGYHTNYGEQGAQVLVQPDGSIYFLLAAPTQIVKRLSDESTDLNYGSGGFSVTVPISNPHAILQADGKIVVAGTNTSKGNGSFALARFNIDGSLDKTFNGTGQQTTDVSSGQDGINSIAIQSDGKIVVAGFSSSGSYSDFALARYNTNGLLDNAFNGDGIQTTNLGDNDIARSVVIQSDGKIVLGGTNKYLFVLVRYSANGTLEDTFNGGQSLTNSNGAYFSSNALAIQKDNKIVAAGSLISNSSYEDFTIVRFNVNGSLDKTFGSNGIQNTDFRTYNDHVTSLAIQGDGKLVAVGAASNGRNVAFGIARYNTNGSIDSTFDADGKKMTFIGTGNTLAVSVAIQSNGKIVSVGYGPPGSAGITSLKAIRYNTNGSLDSTFGNDGSLSEYKKQGGKTVYASTAIQSNGKPVFAGYTWNGSNFNFLVTRYNTDGKLDNTFSGDGSQITNFGSADNKVTAVAIQKDGKIVVTGGVSNGNNYDFGIVRYNANGSLDSTFSGDGKATTDFGFNDFSNSLVIQSDGKIVVVGYTIDRSTEGHQLDYAIARYNTDGSLDKSFSGDGMQITNFGLESKANSVAIQSDGKIVVAGSADEPGFRQFALARYNTDGSLDNTFHGNGLATTDFLTFYPGSNSGTDGEAVATSVRINTYGKIIVAGYAGFSDRYYNDNNTAIASYNPDGSFDNTFSGDGVGIINLNAYSQASSIALQADNKIVISSNLFVPDAFQFNLIPAGFAIARINPDGYLDPTFGLKGIHTDPNPNLQISGIAISNNKLYAAGSESIDSGSLGVAERYLLAANKPPTVSITSPANNAVYAAPATITINAVASDSDGIVTSVKFYNGSTYLKTDFTSPYSYTISNLPAGTYIITAKATDNAGAQTVSAPVKVIVNKAPVVSITSPANNTTFTASANITVNAAASDADGSIYSVKFYNGTTYLRTDFASPYSYTISNLPAGTYSLTAKATDNDGAQTISAPVTVKVLNAAIVSNRPYSETEKTALNDVLALRLSPNPASNIVNIFASGLQQNRPVMLSVISASGIVMKTMQMKSLDKIVQLDVSSLVSGVYTLKFTSGGKTLFKQFVKL